MNLVTRIRRMEASPPLFASPLAPLCSVREFWLFFCITTLLLLQARIICWYVNSYDVWIAFLPWLQYIAQHGHLHALRDPIGDYLPGYYVLLWAWSRLARYCPPVPRPRARWRTPPPCPRSGVITTGWSRCSSTSSATPCGTIRREPRCWSARSRPGPGR